MIKQHDVSINLFTWMFIDIFKCTIIIIIIDFNFKSDRISKQS